MRPVFIVHVTGSTPHAIDKWTKPYANQHTAAGQATRLLGYPRRLGRPYDWKARIYRISREDFRGNDPGPVLTLVQVIE